jgi:dTDP-4-amino-4,6-dideoxygalactose transaminase/glycosyltransferase involved in cell wall biosynthesis
MRGRAQIAVVVPVYGNEHSLRILYERIIKATQFQNIDLTIQFVNDRSPDNSQAILEQLAKEDHRVRVLLLSKNHGSFVAIVAGLNEVKDHDAAIIMSADLQDPPELISEMVESWQKGKPVVLCVRRNRHDPVLSKLFSNIFAKLFRKLVMPEMPEGGFDFCLIDQRVVQVIIASSEKSTSLVGLIMWAGFERAYISYDRAAREHGKSMWTFRKKARYAINSIISFSSLPLKLVGLIGIILSILCLIGMAYIVVLYLFSKIYPPLGWTSLMFSVLLIGSFQLISLGILGEYFWNNLEQTRKRPLFIVDRRITPDGEKADVSGGDEVPFYDVRVVSRHIRGSLLDSCNRVFRSNRLILGSEVAHFENELADYLGVSHVVGVGNATDALTLSLMAMGIKPGDKVITTALSAPATAVAILRAGATPVFVDVDPVYLTIAPDAIERGMAYGATAIVPVHLYGNACDMQQLIKIAEQYKLIVVEDCAQSLGTTIDGKHCGSFAKIAAFSFYPTKNLGGYGDGGAIVTSDTELAEKLRRMRFYGQNATGECVRPGLNSRLDELQAALLRDRLKILDEQNDERREIARRYDHELEFLNPVPSKPGRAPHLYVVRPENRDLFRAFLRKEGIQTGVHYPLALPRHAYLREYGIDTGCPIAESVCETVVSLPCYPGMTNQQIQKIISSTHSYCSKEI